MGLETSRISPLIQKICYLAQDLFEFDGGASPQENRIALWIANTGTEQFLLDSVECPNKALFCRFTIEVFVVGLRVSAGMMNNTIPMIRR